MLREGNVHSAKNWETLLKPIQRRAYERFYLRQGYLLRRLSWVSSFRELVRQGRAAVGLIGGRFFS